MTDMVIPPARERLVRAAAYALYIDRWHGDPTEGQFTHERYDDAEQQATVAVDAVLALLPAEAETKALVETATRLGRELGRREALKEIADGMGFESHFPDYVTVQLDLDTFGQLLAAREIATKEPK